MPEAMKELFALYDVTSFSFPQTSSDLLEELVEKASRLFGAIRIALALPERNAQQVVHTWGFRNIKEAQQCLAEAGDHCFVYRFRPESLGWLYIECPDSLSPQEHRLCLILARTVEGIIQQKKAQDDLLASEQEKAIILDSLAEQLVFMDENQRIRWVNASAARLIGMKSKQVVGKHCQEIIKGHCGPCNGCPAVMALQTGEPKQRVVTTGRERILDIRSYPVKREDGSIKGVLGTISDITEQVQAKEALRLLEDRYRHILTTLQEGYYEVDLAGTITFCNKAADHLLGYKSGELIGKNFRSFVRKPYSAFRTFGQVFFTGQPKRGLVLELLSKRGNFRFIELSITPILGKDNSVTGFCGLALDVTEQKEYQEKLEYFSWHDALTGLFNRAYFEEQLDSLDSIADSQFPVTVLSADLDGLKLINDTMGHVQGDELLKICARILKESIRSGDIVARIGGDEFGLILHKTGARLAEKVIGRIQAAVNEHNRANPSLPLSISIGFATSDGKRSLHDTFRKADDRMFSDKLHRSAKMRSQLVNTLTAALGERDSITNKHAERLQELCLELGKRVGLPPQNQDDLALLARVHDLGKVGIPDSILFKKGPLTSEERTIMQEHSEKGYRIASSSPELAPIARFILCHHERWDGQGYPLGLKEEEIPLECRILALADAYDAMTSDRPYRKAMSQRNALAEIKRGAGTQFDPQLAEEFVRMIRGTDYQEHLSEHTAEK